MHPSVWSGELHGGAITWSASTVGTCCVIGGCTEAGRVVGLILGISWLIMDWTCVGLEVVVVFVPSAWGAGCWFLVGLGWWAGVVESWSQVGRVI